jgi:sortase A
MSPSPRGIVAWLAAPGHGSAQPARRMTIAEILGFSFGLSIMLALFIIGSAIVYGPAIGYAMGATPSNETVTEIAATQHVQGLGHAPAPLVSGSTAAALSTDPLPTVPAHDSLQPVPSQIPSQTTQLPLGETLAPVAGQLRTQASPTPTPRPRPPVPTPVLPRPPADAPPTRLVIPKIHLDTPVSPVAAKEIERNGRVRVVWDTLPRVASFHQTSAYPGHPGNTVINGHRDIEGSVFRHLDKIEIGDRIVLYVGNVAYPYDVTEILVVRYTLASAEQQAEHQRLLNHVPEERLTLVTCTPVGLATHRLYVIAKPPVSLGTFRVE